MTREEFEQYAKENGLIVWSKEMSEKAIKALEQEPKTGYWYRQTNDYVDFYECSECGMATGIYDVKNYCPNCGAKMAETEADMRKERIFWNYNDAIEFSKKVNGIVEVKFWKSGRKDYAVRWYE